MDSRRDKLIEIILQEQEEDNELFFLLVHALYSCIYKEKQLVNTSSLSAPAKVKEILEGYEVGIRLSFRWNLRFLRLFGLS